MGKFKSAAWVLLLIAIAIIFIGAIGYLTALVPRTPHDDAIAKMSSDCGDDRPVAMSVYTRGEQPRIVYMCKISRLHPEYR